MANILESILTFLNLRWFKNTAEEKTLLPSSCLNILTKVSLLLSHSFVFLTTNCQATIDLFSLNENRVLGGLMFFYR